MINMFMLLVGFIILIISWRAWKKTARAAVRDRLFSLRDEWRNHYVDNNLDMLDGTYANIRNLINDMLRYTKRMRMIGFLYFAANVSKEDVLESSSRIDASIDKCSAETKELAIRIRRQASESILLYMASTSLGFISAAVFMFVYMLPNKIFSAIKSGVRALVDIKPDTLEYVVSTENYSCAA